MSGRAAGFLVDCSLAVVDPYFSRALRSLAQVLSTQDWIKGLVMSTSPVSGPPVQVRVGEVVGLGGETPLEVDPVRVEGTIRGVSVSIKASVADGGGCVGRSEAQKMLQDLSKIVAGRVAAQNTAGSIGEGGLSEIMGTLSHDLRTPLACIKGYLSLLDEGKYAPGSAEWSEFFSLVVGECDRLERLVATLLESGADERDIKLACEPVLVPPLINHILLEESIVSNGHRFAVDVAPEARIAWADPIRLEQVLTNLVDNAVKYSPDHSLVMIRVRKTGDEILFSVADQGIGIPPEHLNRLFERFYRVRDKSSTHIRGTGLGLPIARQLVEAHGGDIWAESVAGSGSTFHFTLPVGGMQRPEEAIK